MQTMNPVLQVGGYNWDPGSLPLEEAQARLAAVRKQMASHGWSGLVVFGDRPEHGTLAYLTNFVPRLSGALALIPVDGEPGIISFDGGRMIPAGKETTWVEEVQPAKDLAGALASWIEGFGDGGRIATSDFDMMQAELYEQLETLEAVLDADDATAILRELRRHKSNDETSSIRGAVAFMKQAEHRFRERFANGAPLTDCVLAAESEARRAGAQDVRSLYSQDGGRTLRPVEGHTGDRHDILVAYIAVRNRGYWVDGFLTAGNGEFPAGLAARTALDAMIELAGDGVSKDDLATARDSHLGNMTIHDLIGDGCGHGIGLSIEEVPNLSNGPKERLQAGDVCTLKVGVADDQAGLALASAVVRITESGNEVLWRENRNQDA